MVQGSAVETQLIMWCSIYCWYYTFRPLHWAIIRSRIVPQKRLYSVL